LGTGEAGSGTRARHSWRASTGAGTTEPMIGSVVMFDRANEAPVIDDCVRLDAAAQQLSACSWVIRRFEVVPCDGDLCIGQLVPFTQHAIRASGVACQPVQTATFPTHSVRMAAILARRLLQATHM
jgi:hypothetical protein